MTLYTDLISDLAQKNDKKIVMLVMDGVGGIHAEESPETALEAAVTPNLDALAAKSALGRTIPTDWGITPGSGPGHLALFGYDPRIPEHRIGRGVLEALGIDYELRPGEVAARGNFATIDADGNISDRRAGRPSNEECARISALLDEKIAGREGIEITVRPVREHRFCVFFHGDGLQPDLEDTDPQKTGVPPLKASARIEGGAAKTVRVVQTFIDQAREVLRDEPQVNGLNLRGFSSHPGLPTFQELYDLNPAAVAAYPLYRGVGSLVGMKVLETGTTPAEEFATVAKAWDDHDFFFTHIKKTDSSGEDGNLEAKVAAIEAVDAALPDLLGLKPDVLAIVGDHATPYVMSGHSWHPVPLLVKGPNCDIDGATRYTETEALKGSVGTMSADRLLGYLLANAGKLGKYGA